MSLINQVLRDLDRHARPAAALPATVRSIAATAAPSRRHAGAATALLGLVALAGVVRLSDGPSAPRPGGAEVAVVGRAELARSVTPVTPSVTLPVTLPVTPSVTLPVTPSVTLPLTPPVPPPVTPPVTPPATPPETPPVTASADRLPTVPLPSASPPEPALAAAASPAVDRPLAAGSSSAPPRPVSAPSAGWALHRAISSGFAATDTLAAAMPSTVAAAAVPASSAAPNVPAAVPAAAALHVPGAAAPNATSPPPPAAAPTPPAGPVRIEKRAAIGPAERSEAAYRLGADAQERGDHLEAAREYAAALQEAPALAAARAGLAGVRVAQGRAAEAEDLLRAGLASGPPQALLAMPLARLLAARGEWAAAIGVMRAGLPGLAAGNADYRACFGAILQRAGQHPEAVEQFSAALRLAPGNGVWWMGMAISLAADNQVDAARSAYQQALSAGGLSTELAKFVEQRLRQLR